MIIKKKNNYNIKTNGKKREKCEEKNPARNKEKKKGREEKMNNTKTN